MNNRIARGLFVIALGVLWIGLALALPLSRPLTAALAALALVAGVAAVLVGGSGEVGGGGQAGKRWRGLSFRKKVNAIAATTALLTFIGVGTALLLQPLPAKSSGRVPGEVVKTTTTTKETGSNKDGPAEKFLHTQVDEEKEPVDKPDESLLGRAVDNSAGVVIVRLGLALLAAFISGFAVQRIALGKYAVTLPFGLGALPDVTEEQTKATTEKGQKDPALKQAVQEVKAEDGDEDMERIADPKKELIAVGINSELALRRKAAKIGIAEDAPVDELIKVVGDKSELGPYGMSALRDVFELSGQAERGADVDPGVELWLQEYGRHLPAAIEKLSVE